MYHNMIKNNSAVKIYVKTLRTPPSNFFLEHKLSQPAVEAYLDREMYDIGLKAISEGRLGLILCSGLWRKIDRSMPNLLFKPNWKLDLNLLEYVVKRLKYIGEYGSRTLT